MSRESDSTMSFVAGAAIGATVGAVVALLLAPQAGEETRKMIKDKAQDLGKEVDKFRKDMEPKIQQAKKDIKRKLAK